MRARVTVRTRGWNVGDVIDVDPDSPDVKALLKSESLVPVDLPDHSDQVDVVATGWKAGTLGRLVEHDERSREYPAMRLEAGQPRRRVLWQRMIPVFDQGHLGSCTGNAVVGAAGTVPLWTAAKVLDESVAVSVYELATTLDQAPGSYPPDDTGSSGLAACKAAKKLGLIGGYKHAFGVEHALDALQHGPVITGVAWHEGFDRPDHQGRVVLSGAVRGGHEFVVIGHDPASGYVTAVNSWGQNWGVAGLFAFTSADWATLLADYGDVTVPHL